MRLFFGFKLSAELGEILSRSQTRLVRSIPTGFSPASLEQLHLTLLFLGERPDNELPMWITTLKECTRSKKSFKISLLGLSAFPTPKDPRVVWAGIKDETGGLKEIVDGLRTAARKHECAVEEREFMPHLTLGRNKAARNSTSLRLFIEREKLPPHSESVSRIILFESKPGSGGHRYTEVASSVLEQGSDASKS